MAAWPHVTERVNLGPMFDELDPFDDDEEIVAMCDLENPESCESCT
jgi:hypothetical protein